MTRLAKASNLEDRPPTYWSLNSVGRIFSGVVNADIEQRGRVPDRLGTLSL